MMDKEFHEYERLYMGKTTAYDYSIIEHYDRYKLAKRYVSPNDVVLDAASGSGYGTEYLHDAAKKVIGVEISEHALHYARENHSKDNVEYRHADLDRPLDFPDSFFDVITSFETIEHVPSPEKMLAEFKRVLKPDGVLIVSSPDREIINEDGITHNKYHISELSKKEFIEVVSRFFSVEELFGQTKHIVLPWWKRTIKKISKLDTFGIRRGIVKMLGLKYMVHKHFTPHAEIPIEKTASESKERYYTLILVCKNNKSL